ncbi:hypothetical protein [Roseomonas xinghualingensis]|uniref:hypothetical protein n=1 Tax=Roseomonas xinghualingensis TaxID=2986475 RepID=UPI0021F0B0ED|nr:hypothetical protein [Roseomonas sp. SXEYE001]MCV4210079.1 hypothetical protein [Roseomonas sp. SXEYE001]
MKAFEKPRALQVQRILDWVKQRIAWPTDEKALKKQRDALAEIFKVTHELGRSEAVGNALVLEGDGQRFLAFPNVDASDPAGTTLRLEWWPEGGSSRWQSINLTQSGVEQLVQYLYDRLPDVPKPSDEVWPDPRDVVREAGE